MTRFLKRTPALKRLLTVAALSGLAAGSLASGAAAEVKTYKFGKSGNWTIQAVYDDNGAFSHCSAQVRYKSGLDVFLIAYAKGVWSIQFYNKEWPQRPVSTFPATLKVDGRTVMSTEGKYRGRSAFIDLGDSADRLRAIMLGNIMTVVTPSGTSSFRLTGTNQASRVVSSCWSEHRERSVSNNNGAFGAPPKSNEGAFGAPPTPNSGAFGAAPTPPSNGSSGAFATPPASPPKSAQGGDRHVKLERTQTLEYALRYLAKATMRYEILATEKNFFKHFPVNWKYGNGDMGGMMILDTTRLDAESGLQTLLTDQAKWCTGQSSTERKPTTGAVGQRLARARGVCATGSDVATLEYSVAEMGNQRIVMIIESQQKTAPSANRAPPSDNLPLPPSATNPGIPNASQPSRVPDKNEL